MREVYVVTGNSGKLRELQTMFAGKFTLRAKKLDLTEIQSMDSEEIVRDKLKRAFAIVKKPVIVEDVSVELACLKGLPGPFMRHFEDVLGKSALYELTKHADDTSAEAHCTMGYYDGRDMKIVDGQMRGHVVAPRGQNGFGFDFVFVAEGQTRTNAELDPAEKDKFSHRARAIEQLLKLLT
jgi:inosine triphosphate pyrophosphatase